MTSTSMPFWSTAAGGHGRLQRALSPRGPGPCRRLPPARAMCHDRCAIKMGSARAWTRVDRQHYVGRSDDAVAPRAQSTTPTSAVAKPGGAVHTVTDHDGDAVATPRSRSRRACRQGRKPPGPAYPTIHPAIGGVRAVPGCPARPSNVHAGCPQEASHDRNGRREAAGHGVATTTTATARTGSALSPHAAAARSRVSGTIEHSEPVRRPDQGGQTRPEPPRRDAQFPSRWTPLRPR